MPASIDTALTLAAEGKHRQLTKGEIVEIIIVLVKWLEEME